MHTYTLCSGLMLNVNPIHPQKITFEPNSSYLLKNLKPFSTYTFQLAARSKHGVGAFTGEITIQTPQTRMYICLSHTFLIHRCIYKLTMCSQSIRIESVMPGSHCRTLKSPTHNYMSLSCLYFLLVIQASTLQDHTLSDYTVEES